MKKIIFITGLSILLTYSVMSKAEKLPEPESLQISKGLSSSKVELMLKAAQRYFEFWNTGDEHYAKDALSSDFIDLNLPDGRPQGPTGPLAASKTFRKAVPDLSVKVQSVYVLENKVIAQLAFSGHFTGIFGDLKGKGQEISFMAVDMYTIKNDRITENWHLEDNLALMLQLGAAVIK